MHGFRVAFPRPPSESVGELGVRRAGPVAMVWPRVRNQSVVVVAIVAAKGFVVGLCQPALV
jgi:hypothetical protein